MASAPLRKGNFKELITPGLRASFNETLEARQKLFKSREIFGMGTTTQHSETTVGVGALAPGSWNFKKQGRIQYSGLEELYAKEWISQEFANGMMAERALVDDILDNNGNIPRQLAGKPVALAEALAIFRETAAAEVFNYAFTDSGTTPIGFDCAGPDAVGLCSTVHTHSSTNASTFSNEYALELTVDNLDTVCVALEEMVDDQGQKIGTGTRKGLIVPTALRRRARTIMESDKEPGHANNDANVVGGEIEKLVVWPFLTDPTAWFVYDLDRTPNHLLWLERIAPDFQSAFDDDTQQYKWSAYNRFTRGWDDAKWVVGSKP